MGSRIWFLVFGPVVLLLPHAPAAEPAPITVTNYTEGETVRFPVPLIKGDVAEGDSVQAVNTSSKRTDKETTGLVRNGKFKVLCELVPGVNKIQLRAGKAVTTLTLKYVPQTNPYVVRVIYMTDKTGDTDYQTPQAKDPQNFRERLDTAMKLMQTVTAERNFDQGFGRRTFNLEFDPNGRVKVHVFKGALAAAEYYKMSDQEWYRRVANEVEKTHPTERAKNVVIAAYTRFDPKTGKVQGHTALGGGGQGLFGSGNLFTWPASVGAAQAAFSDERQLNPKEIMSDSAFRNTYWAAASTTMGATLHELGHAFGLPHTRDPMDVMTRGFDHFNRVFTFVDPPSATSARPIEFDEKKVAAFAPVSAAALITSPWLAHDAPAPAGGGDTRVRFDPKAQKLVAQSSKGVRYVGVFDKGDMVHFAAPPADKPAPRTFSVDAEPFRSAAGDGGRLIVIDAVGNRSEIEMKGLLKDAK